MKFDFASPLFYSHVKNMVIRFALEAERQRKCASEREGKGQVSVNRGKRHETKKVGADETVKQLKYYSSAYEGKSEVAAVTERGRYIQLTQLS